MANCFTIYKRFLSTSHIALSNVLKHVTVIGGGLMGSGIAQVTVQSGMDATIIEVNEDALKKSDANIKSSLQRVAKKLFQNSPNEAEKYFSESMGRLKITLDLNEAVSKTDLVVEAIVENMDAKHKLFSKIDSIAPEHTIFASNTSSLSITDIAAVTNRKDRFGGLHFFNPVPVMKLLEVIRTEETSEDTYQKMVAWGKAIGKTTITCKDTPGFVVNRLLVPYLAEAARMMERGDASSKDIDIAMKLGAGYPMGPLELLDYVGLDTTKFILDGWHKKFPDHPLFKPIGIIDKLVGDGKYGKKTGEGFYSYKKNSGPCLFIHSPYIHPLPPNPKHQAVPLQNAHDNAGKETLKTESVKKFKIDKNESQLHEEEIKIQTKMGKLERMKRLDRLKNFDKWKNSEEFLKFEREKHVPKKQCGYKRGQFEHYASRDLFKPSLKTRNLEEFIRFERDKNFKQPLMR